MRATPPRAYPTATPETNRRHKMRIWDLNPGYLNRESLLGEHRELHAIVSILVNRKRGYARHPETLRWIGHGWALRQRHRQLAAEMALRGYTDRTPVNLRSQPGVWPATYIDSPFDQIQRLRSKYLERAPGRIPLPVNPQQLWSQHKYSVLARSERIYRETGRVVAEKQSDFSALTRFLCELLRTPPSPGALQNALLHMWGHVADRTEDNRHIEAWPATRLLREIARRAMEQNEPYLKSSTALGELAAWL